MPNLVLFGKQWDTCSDMLPVNLIIPILTYSCWLIPLGITTYIPKEPECYLQPGHTYYRIAITLIFTTFCAQLATEMLTVALALRGNPLETRKRWLAERCLLLTYVVNLVQLGATILGSWTLSHFRNVPCRKDKPLRPLVISSWILLALSLTWTLLCLKWFPNQQGSVEAWVKRLRFLCYLCACLGFQTALEPLRKMDLEEGDDAVASKREEALVEHLAETFHVIFGDVDFTASDRHAALVLATALQQRRRQERIRECLKEGKNPHAPAKENTLEEKQFSRALRHSITQKFPTVVTPSNFAKKVCPELDPQEAADRYTGFSDRVGQEELEEALGYFEYAVAAYYVQDQGLTAGNEGEEDEGGGAETAEEGGKNNRPEPGAHAERPMGDVPPPKNEELADQPAPTFLEHPDPHSGLMLAASNIPGSSGMESSLPAVAEAPSQEGPQSGSAGPSPAPNLSRKCRGAAAAAAASPKNQDERHDLGAQPSPATDSGGPVTSSACLEEDDDSVSKHSARTEVYSTGGRITKLDVRPDGTGADEDGVGKSLVSSVVQGAGGVADVITSGVGGFAKSVAGAVRWTAPPQKEAEGDVEMGSITSPPKTVSSSSVSKIEGVDKTAQKAIKGEMQIGSRSRGGGRPAELRIAIEEGDEGKVESSRCGVCRSAEPVVTPLDKLDCIYSRADNTILGTLPYMIALDWERRAIVLGVRGTSSLSDALTDAIAQPIPILPWLGDIVTEPDNGIASVHSGILASAAALNHDLEDHGILSALLTGAAVDEEAKQAHTAAAEPTARVSNSALAAVLANATDIGPFAAKLTGMVGPAAAGEVAEKLSERLGSLEDREAFVEPAAADGPATPSGMSSSPFDSLQGGSLQQQPDAPVAVTSPAAGTQLKSRPASLAPWQPHATPTESRGGQTAQELMAKDEDVIQQCMGVQQAEKQRNQEARRFQSLKAAGRHSSKFRWNPLVGPGSQRVDGLKAETRRVQSSTSMQRPQNDSATSSVRQKSTETPGNRQHALERVRSPNGVPIWDAPASQKEGQPKRVSYLEKDRRSRSLPLDHSETSSANRDAQQAVDRADASAASREVEQFRQDESGADPAREDEMQQHRSSTERRRSFKLGERRRSLGGVSWRRGRQQEGQMDRAGTTFLADAFQGAGRAVKNLYTDAKELFRDNESPPRSPTRKPKLKGHNNDPVIERLEDMMRNVEAQMKKTFLPKIFKEEQDLRKLEEVAVAQEQQRRRAAFRAKQLKQLEERKLDCRGWQLVLTGHSLGAGVAALLALKLRPRFPDVPIKCWAYCPPGGLVTLGLSNQMATFCTSVIVGKDGVPRASLGNLSRLVDEVVAALARGKRCKTRVLLRNLTARGRAKFRKPGEFYDVDQLPEQCQEVLDEYALGAMKRAEAIGQPVFPPGKLIYCRRLKESATEASYDAIWLPPQEIMKEGFIISSKMLKDHLCDTVTRALETSIERLREAETKEHRAAARFPTSPDSSDGEASETE